MHLAVNSKIFFIIIRKACSQRAGQLLINSRNRVMTRTELSLISVLFFFFSPSNQRADNIQHFYLSKKIKNCPTCRNRTSDLRISEGLVLLQSSALPTELRSVVVRRKRNNKYKVKHIFCHLNYKSYLVVVSNFQSIDFSLSTNCRLLVHYVNHLLKKVHEF